MVATVEAALWESGNHETALPPTMRADQIRDKVTRSIERRYYIVRLCASLPMPDRTRTNQPDLTLARVRLRRAIMNGARLRNGWSRPSFSLTLFIAFLAVLWLSGGASRGDVTGQAVVRAAAWLALVAGVLGFTKVELHGCRTVALLMMAVIAIPLLQLVPLPPSIWSRLEVGELYGSSILDQQVWRPLAMSPGATLNALSSLIVPMTTLFLMTGLAHEDRNRIVHVLLVMVVLSVLTGLLQLSGGGFFNPLINYPAGSVSGTFANRNHFALLLAIGCMIVPLWALTRRDQAGWRLPVGIGLALLVALTILASGSRAGMLLGALALILAPLIVREQVARLFRGLPRWAMPTAIGIVIASAIAIIALSFYSGRAESINRLASADIDGDMRNLGLPAAIEIAKAYFPFGVGVGGFDAAFRIVEPTEILQIYYFNHAHNDWLELVLESGVLGLAVAGAAILWWLAASVKVWPRSMSVSQARVNGRFGSAALFLIMLASIVDYPARTPLIMAIAVIAALLLAWGTKALGKDSLPDGSRPL